MRCEVRFAAHRGMASKAVVIKKKGLDAVRL